MINKTITTNDYCEALLDICQFLHLDMQKFLECEGRYRGTAKTLWCNMREAWKRMNLKVDEDNIEIYGHILAYLRGSVYKEFSRLKNRKLSAADRIIVLIKRLLDISREYASDDFRFKKELESAYKGNQKLYDNIRNYAKKDSLYVFSDKIRNAIQEKKVGKYQQDDFDLYNVEHPKPKSLELRGEKTLLSSPSREDSKKSEIKF